MFASRLGFCLRRFAAVEPDGSVSFSEDGIALPMLPWMLLLLFLCLQMCFVCWTRHWSGGHCLGRGGGRGNAQAFIALGAAGGAATLRPLSLRARRGARRP